VAVSSRRLEQAQEYAATFHIPNAFDEERALASHPEVDLVVILAPAPEHVRLVKIAIAAGKDVSDHDHRRFRVTTGLSRSQGRVPQCRPEAAGWGRVPAMCVIWSGRDTWARSAP